MAISYYEKEYSNRFLYKESASFLAVTITLGVHHCIAPSS
jgi:hypothetical protein